MSVLVDHTVGGDVDDLDELGAGQLTGTARGEVVRVTGDPECVETELSGERNQQTNGA
jgi:hypothetical protein